MTIKTWQERMPEVTGYADFPSYMRAEGDCMQAEIDELRAELAKTSEECDMHHRVAKAAIDDVTRLKTELAAIKAANPIRNATPDEMVYAASAKEMP